MFSLGGTKTFVGDLPRPAYYMDSSLPYPLWPCLAYRSFADLWETMKVLPRRYPEMQMIFEEDYHTKIIVKSQVSISSTEPCMLLLGLDVVSSVDPSAIKVITPEQYDIVNEASNQDGNDDLYIGLRSLETYIHWSTLMVPAPPIIRRQDDRTNLVEIVSCWGGYVARKRFENTLPCSGAVYISTPSPQFRNEAIDACLERIHAEKIDARVARVSCASREVLQRTCRAITSVVDVPRQAKKTKLDFGLSSTLTGIFHALGADSPSPVLLVLVLEDMDQIVDSFVQMKTFFFRWARPGTGTRIMVIGTGSALGGGFVGELEDKNDIGLITHFAE